jgi:hypothetical protein
MDYMLLAKEKVQELVNYIQLLSEEDKKIVADFLLAVNNNKRITHHTCVEVLNIHKKALRKSFKLHRQAKREYGAENKL